MEDHTCCSPHPQLRGGLPCSVNCTSRSGTNCAALEVSAEDTREDLHGVHRCSRGQMCGFVCTCRSGRTSSVSRQGTACCSASPLSGGTM